MIGFGFWGPVLVGGAFPALPLWVGDKAMALRLWDSIALGGIEDHVHLLIQLPFTTSVADLMHQVKGGSSYLVTHELRPGEFFKWQGSYGAVSVSP